MLVMITGAGLWESSVRIAHAAPNFECATSTGVDTGTCEALVDLYTATDGDNWIHTEGWLVDTNVCNWYGVYCYVSGHNLTGVGTLRLRDNNLS